MERSTPRCPKGLRYVFRVFRMDTEHGVRERIDDIPPQLSAAAADAAGRPLARFHGDEVYIVRRVLTFLH